MGFIPSLTIYRDSGCRFLCRKRASGESISDCHRSQRPPCWPERPLIRLIGLVASQNHYGMHLMFSVLVCDGLERETYERNENFRTTPKLPLTATSTNVNFRSLLRWRRTANIIALRSLIIDGPQVSQSMNPLQLHFINQPSLLFTVRRYALHDICYRNSVCLSVCPSVRPSVTLVDCVHMVRPTIMISSPHGSPIILVSGDITFIPKFEGGHPKRGR